MPRTGGGITTTTSASWIDGEALEQRALDGRRRLLGVAGARLERLERQEDRAGVGSVGEGGAREADEVHGVRDARHLQGDVHDLRG